MLKGRGNAKEKERNFLPGPHGPWCTVATHCIPSSCKTVTSLNDMLILLFSRKNQESMSKLFERPFCNPIINFLLLYQLHNHNHHWVTLCFDLWHFQRRLFLLRFAWECESLTWSLEGTKSGPSQFSRSQLNSSGLPISRATAQHHKTSASLNLFSAFISFDLWIAVQSNFCFAV